MGNTIPMGSVNEKIKSTNGLPNRPPIDYVIAKCIVDELGDPLEPAGFALGAELALDRLLKGPDAFTNQRLYELMGSGGYPRFGQLAIDIAKAFCPKDFTRGVRDYYNGFATHLKESPK